MLKKIKSNLFLIFGILLIIMIISAALTFYFKTKEEEKFKIDPLAQLIPDKKYQIVYWDYPLFIGQDEKYDEFLQKAINEFNQLYPTIKVEYKLLSFITGEDKLKKRLKSGNPPDIYHNISESKLFNKKLQIPVNIYLKPPKPKDKEEKPENDLNKYNKLALNGYYSQESIWGLPNFLTPAVWAGNKKLLNQTNLNLNLIKANGWTWNQFYESTQQIKNFNKNTCIIFNPYNSKLFYQLLATTNNSQLISTDEELKLILNKENIELIFSLLDKLRTNKSFYKKSSQMNKKLLPYFWQGKASIIAPVNPWLLNHLYKRDKKEQNVDLTLLPIPAINNQSKKAPVIVTGLTLFRQQEYQGDDHTKAVYKFAKFINQKKSLEIAKKLKIIPAYLPVTTKWKEEVNLIPEHKEQLITYVDRGRVKQLMGTKNIKLEAELKKVIDQNYRRFWLNKLSPSRVAKDIINDCQQLINKFTVKDDNSKK